MIQLLPLTGDVGPAIRALGWDWVLADVSQQYVAREAVQLPDSEADELLVAADTLYQLFVQSIPDSVPDTLLRQLAIPENLWAAVRHSWADDRHWHLYGRFDLAHTPDGPKLLEFNADTATNLPETAVVQWASLVAAKPKTNVRPMACLKAYKTNLPTGSASTTTWNPRCCSCICPAAPKTPPTAP